MWLAWGRWLRGCWSTWGLRSTWSTALLFTAHHGLLHLHLLLRHLQLMLLLSHLMLLFLHLVLFHLLPGLLLNNRSLVFLLFQFGLFGSKLHFASVSSSRHTSRPFLLNHLGVTDERIGFYLVYDSFEPLGSYISYQAGRDPAL